MFRQHARQHARLALLLFACAAPTGPACLQPQYLSADSGSISMNLKRGEGTAGSGPFIFDPHAAKRKAASAAAAAQAAIPEWVSRVL
jgi:hypothetical protein